MIKEEIKQLIENAIKQKADFSVEIPVEKRHGDYSTNVAIILSKKLKRNPVGVANNIIAEINQLLIQKRLDSLFEKIEAAGPGFINFFISQKYLQKQIKVILKEKDNFGNLKIGRNKKANVEFISANPTGPLTLGNGMGGFGGDVLANVLARAGYKVFREYYVNNVGGQIDRLGHSILGDQEAVYKGEYIEKLRNQLLKNKKTPPTFKEAGERAAKIILEKMIKPSIKKMGIKFDKWFFEETLYKSGEIDKTINELKNKGFTYEKEGALWFKSKDFGDDNDRVLIKSDGTKTYFASDIAYLKNKFKRGFNKLIIILGADHHGYVQRLKAASQALGHKKEDVEIIILQLVRIFEKGEEVRMSKRSGTYITIDELIDEVGLDATRFFFLQRSFDTHFNFNLDLAKERSERNPVFKIQYAYARICSIFRRASNLKWRINRNLHLIKEPSELDLIKQLIKYPEIIENIAKNYQLQRLPNYALELAEALHKFYEDCRVISEEKKLTEARLSLILAAKIVLKNVLKVMGISSPQQMKRIELNNKYYIMRHGQAISNLKEVVSCLPESFENPLTEVGRKEVEASARKLIGKKIDLIFSSPLLRAKQTAEIVGKILKVSPEYDERLREINFGIYNSASIIEFNKYFEDRKKRIKKGAPNGGESYEEVLERILSFFKEINKKYKNKNILIISHQAPLFLLEGYLKGFSLPEIITSPKEKQLCLGQVRKIN